MHNIYLVLNNKSVLSFFKDVFTAYFNLYLSTFISVKWPFKSVCYKSVLNINLYLT